MQQNTDYYNNDHKHHKHHKHDRKCKCKKCITDIVILPSTNNCPSKYHNKCDIKYDNNCDNKCAPAIQNPCAFKTTNSIYKNIRYNAKTNNLCYYNGCEWCVITANIISGCGNPNELGIPCYECDIIYIDLINFRLYICDQCLWVEPKVNNLPLVNRPQVLYDSNVALSADTFLEKFPFFQTSSGDITVYMPSAADLVHVLPHVQSYDTLTTYMAIDLGGNSVILVPGDGIIFNGSTTINSGDNVRNFIVQFINVSPGTETVMIY